MTHMGWMLLVQAAIQTTPVPVHVVDAAKPFFTSDWVGFLKVLGVYGSMIGVIAAFIWKVMKGDLQSADRKLDEKIDGVKRDLTTDVNSLGTRVNEYGTACTQVATRQEEMRLAVAQAQGDAKFARESIAEVRAELRGIREANIEAKTDIISHITSSNMNVLSMTSQTNERLAATEAQVRMLADLLKNHDAAGFRHSRKED